MNLIEIESKINPATYEPIYTVTFELTATMIDDLKLIKYTVGESDAAEMIGMAFIEQTNLFTL